MKKILFKTLFVCLFLHCPLLFGQSYAPGRLIVTFVTPTSNVYAASFFSDLSPLTLRALDPQPTSDSEGFSVIEGGYLVAQRYKLYFYPTTNMEIVMQTLRDFPEVLSLRRPRALKFNFRPNDPYYDQQVVGTFSSSGSTYNDGPIPYLQQLNLEKAWNITKGSSSVKIAVIDSGVASSHADLQGSVLSGYNVINDSTQTEDSLGHGTKVAGFAAANTHNNVGIASSGFNCVIYPIKLVEHAAGDDSDLNGAIAHAIQQNVDVINLSLAVQDPGPPSSFSFLQSSLTAAYNAGISVVVAAGNVDLNDAYGYANINAVNGNSDLIFAPAALDHVITVGGALNGVHAENFSYYGSSVDVIAPFFVRGSLLYTHTSSQYHGLTADSGAIDSGTSFATPLVAGIVGLMHAYNSNASPALIKYALQQSATDVGPSGKDDKNGYGFVNAFKALAYVDPTPPVASIASIPSVHNIGDGIVFNLSIQDNFLPFCDTELPANQVLSATLNYSGILADLSPSSSSLSLPFTFVSHSNDTATFTCLLTPNAALAELYCTINYRDLNIHNERALSLETIVLRDIRGPVIRFPLNTLVQLSQPFGIHVADNTQISLNSISLSIKQAPHVDVTYDLDDPVLSFAQETNTLTVDLSKELNNQVLQLFDQDRALTYTLSVADVYSNMSVLSHSFIQSSSLEVLGADLKPRIYNAPNPFDPYREDTYLCFELSTAALVDITIYSLAITKIKSLHYEHLNAGYHQIRWDGKDAQGDRVPNGVYLAHLKAKNGHKTVDLHCKIAVLRR
ncbi:MAG: S8 family serine peptidase [bacterium]